MPSNILKDLLPDSPEEQSSEDSQKSSTSNAKNQEAQELIVWDAPNRVYDPKSTQWFLGLFAFGLVSIVAFALLREVMLILVVAAFIFVLYALARVEPSDIEHRVLTSGIEVGGRLYSWEDLKSFWIETATTPPLLKIETKLLMPHSLELLLPDETESEEVEELNNLLSQYLPIEERPHSKVGEMADNALLSLTNFVPQRQRVQSWLERKVLK